VQMCIVHTQLHTQTHIHTLNAELFSKTDVIKKLNCYTMELLL